MPGPRSLVRNFNSHKSRSALASFGSKLWDATKKTGRILAAGLPALAFACGGSATSTNGDGGPKNGHTPDRTDAEVQADVRTTKTSDGPSKIPKDADTDSSVKPKPSSCPSFDPSEINQPGSRFFRMNQGSEVELADGYELEIVELSAGPMLVDDDGEFGRIYDGVRIRLLGPDPENRETITDVFLFRYAEDRSRERVGNWEQHPSFPDIPGFSNAVRLCLVEESDKDKFVELLFDQPIGGALLCHPNDFVNAPAGRVRVDEAIPIDLQEGYRADLTLLGINPKTNDVGFMASVISPGGETISEETIIFSHLSSAVFDVSYPAGTATFKIIATAAVHNDRASVAFIYHCLDASD